MTEVYPGIHWLKMPIGIENSTLTHVNIYLIRGNNGYLLVDSGWNTDSSFAVLHDYLAKNRLGFEDIRQIFISHIHRDHYGMAGRVARLSGAPVLMHQAESEAIDSRYVNVEPLLGQADAMLTANGVPHKDMKAMRDAIRGLEDYVIPCRPDRLLNHGDRITTGEFTFEVMWTPGHASGHLCLYEPEKKILVSGDHILPEITPNVSVTPQSIDNPLGRYIDSLKEVRQRETVLALPGHDQPFTGVRERIDFIIGHHEKRNAEITAAMVKEPMTAFQIAQHVTWGNTAKFIQLPAFHQRMAVFETVAHLDMMTREGIIHRLQTDGIIQYLKN